MRSVTSIALLAALTSSAIGAQSTPPSALAFEVASVKPSPPGATFTRPGSPDPGGRWLSLNATLEMILQRAYPEYSRPGLIVGGPGWLKERRFDIDARATGNPSREQYQQMVRQLLADRFALKVRTESRPIDVYALVIARADGRLGPRLKPASVECVAAVEARRAQVKPGIGLDSMMTPCGTAREGPGRVSGARQISSFLASLQIWMDRRIVDRTGLDGLYEMELEFDFLSLRSVDTGADPDRITIFTALEEQLGLKLEPRRETTDVLVIESVEMPTAN
jgi:uncharacterized protein (TIGR03435 family)